MNENFLKILRPSQKTSTLKAKAKASAMLGRIGPLKKTEHTYERVQCSVAGEGRRGHREVIHTHEFHTWIRRKTTHAPLPPQARAAAAGQVRVHGAHGARLAAAFNAGKISSNRVISSRKITSFQPTLMMMSPT